MSISLVMANYTISSLLTMGLSSNDIHVMGFGESEHLVHFHLMTAVSKPVPTFTPRICGYEGVDFLSRPDRDRACVPTTFFLSPPHIAYTATRMVGMKILVYDCGHSAVYFYTIIIIVNKFSQKQSNTVYIRSVLSTKTGG